MEMKRVLHLFAILMVATSCAFAQSPDSTSHSIPVSNAADSTQNNWVDLGVALEGAFGLWNVKLQEDHLRAPHFAFGLSGLIGFSHFAVRLSALGEYEAVYVSEGTQATINEGFWRLGGGVAVRYQQGKQDGVWAELGTAVLASLSGDVTLCESAEQNIYWGIETGVKVPLELSVGYRFPLGSVALETAAFGSYDLTKSTQFVVNETTRDARAWSVGARMILWAVRL